MKAKLLYLIIILTGFFANAQVSIVGTGVNGWPDTQTTPEIMLSTTDNISYFIPNLVVTNGFVKFRKDAAWVYNWGGSTFPSGTSYQNGPDIPTIAGTYDVTFNISNGTYTFITSGNFPSIGIWGPAVDSQNGFAGQDVDMTTTDGIHYTLSGFYFSSGQAYFRQDNATNFVWGSTSYPTGTAVQSGPSIFIPGGEHFATFNRITHDYTFSFPSVGILGTALGGFDVDDTDLGTVDGFTYTLDLHLNVGEVKFRKDNSWTINWGSNAFPAGTGVQDGANIPIAIDGDYNVAFDRLSGQYTFTGLLETQNFNTKSLTVYPNPTTSVWNFSFEAEKIDSFELYDSIGKKVKNIQPNEFSFSLDGTQLPNGLYFGKITSNAGITRVKLIKH
ncbi:T9SS type A sorting domain-containing protein [Flavobacterium sp.]|uniref:T9SS type A sorting domain-containing protein n=1 Tax=Flavobacterium sp. TaxID=239 RepID=UPI00286A14FA|nr:T9SS type A sorting domain-containing protein [Flavobacterium sp.]